MKALGFLVRRVLGDGVGWRVAMMMIVMFGSMLELVGGARIDLSFLHVNRCLDGITGVGED